MSVTSVAAPAAVSRAELVACVSLATDLGIGQATEHGLRSCVTALRLGETLGLAADDLCDVYDLALLRWIGCTSDTHELAALVDDELRVRSDWLTMDGTPREAIGILMHHVAPGRHAAQRARLVVRAVARMRRQVDVVVRAWSEAGRTLSARMGFSETVQLALTQIAERWDGRGIPRHLEHDASERCIRIVRVATEADVMRHLHDVDAAVAMVRRRRGTAYDPVIADAFLSLGDTAFAGDAEGHDLFAYVLEREPVTRPPLAGEALDEALRAVGDLADLKSPWFTGHSRAVGELAAAAAERSGLVRGEVELVRRAGYVQELGRLGVPTSIWERPGPLSAAEWERVRLHPYVTERAFVRAPSLAPIGALAARHHERLDGSGYHRGLRGSDLDAPARLLQVADSFVALRSARSHRRALDEAESAEVLRNEVRAARLDREAVDAVLGAAGQRVRRKLRDWPGGLTAREVEVLRLLAQGDSNPEIAARLQISRKTASHHVQHIYAKIGASTRAGAALFAVRHGLLPEPGGG